MLFSADRCARRSCGSADSCRTAPEAGEKNRTSSATEVKRVIADRRDVMGPSGRRAGTRRATRPSAGITGATEAGCLTGIGLRLGAVRFFLLRPWPFPRRGARERLVSGFADPASGAPAGVTVDAARLLPEDGEPVDVADLGRVLRGSKPSSATSGPRCWVGLEVRRRRPSGRGG